MDIIAHRGASFYEPENTLRSLRKAIEMDADYVEVDVRLSADDKLVVIHDGKVDRTTNGRGLVKDMDLSSLKELDAGFGENIPTLDEVMNLVKDKIKLIIEIKVLEIEEQLVRAVQNSGIEEVIITSFYHQAVKNIKNLDENIKTGIIFACQPINPEILALDASSDVMFPKYKFLNRKMVKKAHDNKLSIYPWTVDDPNKMEELYLLDVDGIVTNKLIKRI
jgi:glycerophosphoryl diester phosphodiesterase